MAWSRAPYSRVPYARLRLGAATTTIQATLTATQGAQTVTATATVLVSATLTKTQGAQTLTATAINPISATLTATQGANTITAAGTVLVAANLTLTQGGNTLVATAFNNAPTLGTIAQTQGAQTVVATAMLTSIAPTGGAPNYQYPGEATPFARDGSSALFDTSRRAEQRAQRLAEARQALGLVPPDPEIAEPDASPDIKPRSKVKIVASGRNAAVERIIADLQAAAAAEEKAARIRRDDGDVLMLMAELV